jgi:hypothetical protein
MDRERENWLRHWVLNAACLIGLRNTGWLDNYSNRGEAGARLIFARRAWRGGECHARNQDGDRPRQHHESRKDPPGLGFAPDDCGDDPFAEGIGRISRGASPPLSFSYCLKFSPTIRGFLHIPAEGSIQDFESTR